MYTTDQRDDAFFDRNAQAEPPTVFFMGAPLHKCTFPGCTSEPHPQSDSFECGWHTLNSTLKAEPETGRDDATDAEVAKWSKIVLEEGQ